MKRTIFATLLALGLLTMAAGAASAQTAAVDTAVDADAVSTGDKCNAEVELTCEDSGGNACVLYTEVRGCTVDY